MPGKHIIMTIAPHTCTFICHNVLLVTFSSSLENVVSTFNEDRMQHCIVVAKSFNFKMKSAGLMTIKLTIQETNLLKAKFDYSNSMIM